MKKHKTNDTIFTSENDISFYLLGAFITDGNISVDNNENYRLSICSKDIEWISVIRNLIVPDAIIHKNNECYELRFRSETIKNWLISYGCTPHKSKTVQLMKPIPNQYIPDFIRGVIDGDGCICASHYTKQLVSGTKLYKKLDFYITSGSKIFAEQINKMIQPYCKSRIYTKNIKQITMKSGKIIKPTTYWSIQSGRLEVKNFLNKIYYMDNKLNLARKQKIVDQYCR
jgi:hypothetical protein